MQDDRSTLLISPFFDAGLPSGGVLHSIDVTREWLRRGRRVGVVCSARPRTLGDLQPYLDDGQLALYAVISQEELRFTHRTNERLLVQTREILDEFGPDVVHVHNIHGLVSAIHAALESTTPVMLTALDFGLLCFNFCLYDGSLTPCEGPDSAEACARCVANTLEGPTPWLGQRLPRSVTRKLWPRFVRLDQIKSAAHRRADLRHVIRSLAAIIAPSPIVADRLRAFGAPAERVWEVLYGLAEAKTARPAKTESTTLRLAYLGGVEPIKGLDVLIRAAEILPDDLGLTIRAIGGEPVRTAIEGATARARRYLRYHPPLFGQALAAEHARIDALLWPSICHENSPYAVLESLANGTPVIASDQAGVRHLIEPDRNGWLLEPGDPHVWAKTITAAAQSPETLRAMSPACRFDRTVADFVDDLERIETDLVQGAPTRGTEAMALSSTS